MAPAAAHPGMGQAYVQFSLNTNPHENLTKWVEFSEPCLQMGKLRLCKAVTHSSVYGGGWRQPELTR